MCETYDTMELALYVREFFGVDVSGEYILEYGTNCILSKVQRQVVECACVMGPCRRRLS